MATAASSAAEVEFVPWRQFRDGWSWRQGEHLTIVGPTGSGKTTAALALLSPAMRPAPYTAVFATKRRDPLLDDFGREGFIRLRDWSVPDPELTPRVLISPKLKGFDSIAEQRRVFREALDSIFRQGGWTLYLDEARYITDYLGLSREVEVIWQQGRSHGVSVVAGAQRPRHVPLLAYDQATHLFFFHNVDEQSLRRLGELGGGVDAGVVREAVRLLPSHEMLYLNTDKGELTRTRVEV